ncbi:NADH dehydrogenase [ubiquinone] 1 beta subcomplex subunit 9 [Onthophagus taurus]|uniref:NADH dehydrogenase [ubiquinone] 1 beta subcomplex subunit 9 n=1 Tax=Onthophagus taurus TaxID=166361 RepID=UPI000C20A965|nr:NADH dehydrogenase [ubiquinone] 1 beta subcomplex subunit 9 [Onthophagus taurus]
MANLPTGIVSHTRRVQSLYKKALRSLEDWYDRREVFRYQAVLMRQRFEENRNVKDMRVANSIVELGEEELFQKAHWLPKKFPLSPGGVAYQREVIPPDWIIDHWHPLEKAQYPEYFAKRELRKKEFIREYEKKYGKASVVPHH